MNKELVCITCPMSCHLHVELDEQGTVINVIGNTCPRGAMYAEKELKSPERMITSTVKIEGGIHPLLPVISDCPIPKNKIFDVMEEINKITIKSPVKYQDVIIENVCNTGVNIISSRDM